MRKVIEQVSRVLSFNFSKSMSTVGAIQVLHRRGLKTLKFADTTEVVYERADYPKSKLSKIFSKDIMAVIGYGTQGMAQSLNMKDNGLKVIIGVRKNGASWDDALKDGWIPGESLFSIEEACQKGTVIMNLLSDAGQKGLLFAKI